MNKPDGQGVLAGLCYAGPDAEFLACGRVCAMLHKGKAISVEDTNRRRKPHIAHKRIKSTQRRPPRPQLFRHILRCTTNIIFLPSKRYNQKNHLPSCTSKRRARDDQGSFSRSAGEHGVVRCGGHHDAKEVLCVVFHETVHVLRVSVGWYMYVKLAY